MCGWFLRHPRPRVAGAVCRAPCGGPARRAAHPEMAERRRAGGGERTRSEVGTVQGGSISPLLANLCLHYVFDLWAQRWRKAQARGDMILVRFADDFIVGFEHREEAESFLAELRGRFAKFGLTLHPDKTRLIEFGRFAERARQGRGDGKPETFDFLGFTHSCGKTRWGKFTVLRQTMRRRWQAKLKAVTVELATPARTHSGGGRLSALGRGRPHAVLRSAHEREQPRRLPPGHRPALVAGSHAPQPRASSVVGADEAVPRPVAATRPYLSSLAAGAVCRPHPRQEPDAVMPHVRIRGGGHEQSSIPTPTVRFEAARRARAMPHDGRHRPPCEAGGAASRRPR